MVRSREHPTCAFIPLYECKFLLNSSYPSLKVVLHPLRPVSRESKKRFLFRNEESRIGAHAFIQMLSVTAFSGY